MSCNSKTVSFNIHNIIDAGYKFVYDIKKSKETNIYMNLLKQLKSQKKV